ncbi:ParB N-terminal domain-containing protein [Bartonella sp. C271]|uniref:ParB N-terminal domain-containing protein n=1 Tax=Bartonella sp. C271 TaxID=3070220 RepID=UPI0038B521A6
MANTKKISLKKLKLDLKKPRIPRCATEKDAINFLCKTEQISELAKDIAENGISPCEKLIVLQDEKKYIVAEGNRRLVALKLLDNPNLTPEPLLKTFSKFSVSRKVQINSIECVIVSDREKANHWIETKHSGQNNGKGVKPWNAIHKARYFPKNENRFAYLLFDFLLEDVSQFYKITNVTRFISGSTFLNILESIIIRR